MFVSGEYFKNNVEWKRHLDRVTGAGGHVPNFLYKAIENKAVDPFDSEYTNFKKTNLCFRGQTFNNFTELAAFQFKNSPSIYEFATDVKAEFVRLVNMRAIKLVSREVALAPDSIISPLQWVRQCKPDGSVKSRLILHSKANTLYTRPRFSLCEIGTEVHCVAKFQGLVKVDEKDCYYQFGVIEDAKKLLRFKLDLPGEPIVYGEWQCLVMGLSSSPFIVHLSNRFLVESYSILTGLYGDCFIDDIWTEFRPNFIHFDRFCENLGIVFKESKKEVGAQISLLGIDLDLDKKLAFIPSKKASVIELDAGRFLAAGAGFPAHLSAFVGRLEFASKITAMGRSKSASLVSLLAEFVASGGDVVSDEVCLNLRQNDMKELLFWRHIKGPDYRG